MRVDPERGQDWKAYAKSLIIFSLAGWLLLYFILRTQTLWNFTGLNPLGFHSAPWNVTFNTTSSFLTNTNWQYYGGETTMSYFSQMAGLTVQNFLSAGVGIVVAVALIRGIIGRSGKSLGNFWQDIVRTVLYVLLPLSIIVALVLVSQGVDPELHALPDASHGITGLPQTIAMGPVASQEAIKELGTNGGGFFNINSAHPFENPTGFTNFVEMLLVLIIPAALVFMYGRMVGNRRQGYAIYATMMIMFLGAVIVCYIAEAHGSPAQHAAGLHTAAIARLHRRQPGGQGAALRHRRLGAVRRRHHGHLVRRGQQRDRVVHRDRRRGPVRQPVGASEVIFGGVGTGLYSILLYVLLAVFIGGLMVGRTPEYLGKKIEAQGDQAGRARDPDHAAGGAVLHRAGDRQPAPGAPRSPAVDGQRPAGLLRDLLRLPLSQANNNGSAFAGYTGFIQPNAGNLGSHGITFADLLGGFDMLFARYAPILFALAVAGALAGKRVSPAGLGTMRTDNPTFVVLLIGVIVLVGALTFFPALLLGPIVQGLTGHLYS